MSIRKQARLEAKQFIDSLTVQPFPNSQKVYVQGSRADIQVPMREISLADSLVGGTKKDPILEPNEPIRVYDTSGFYTDPNQPVNIYDGLEKVRSGWIEERGDTVLLEQSNSVYTKERLSDETLDELRFDARIQARQAAEGHCVTQLHYARKGIVTPEMEYIAIRENMGRAKYADEVLNQQHPGIHFGANLPLKLPPSSYAKKSLKVVRLFLPISITLNLNQ